MAEASFALNPGGEYLGGGPIADSANGLRVRWPPRMFGFVWGIDNDPLPPSVARFPKYSGRPEVMNMRFDWVIDTQVIYTHFPRQPLERIALPVEVVAIQQAYINEKGEDQNAIDAPHIMLYVPTPVAFYFVGMNTYINF